MQNRILLDLENYMIPLEEIIKKYVIIEDLDLCLFNKKLRYPIARNCVDRYDSCDITTIPTLSMYCGPLVRDIIKIIFARNSKYYEYFKSSKVFSLSNTKEFSIIFDKYFKKSIFRELSDMVFQDFKQGLYNKIINFILSGVGIGKSFTSISTSISDSDLIESLALVIGKEVEHRADLLFDANIIPAKYNHDKIDTTYGYNFIYEHDDFITDLILIGRTFYINNNGYKLNSNGIFNIEALVRNSIDNIEEYDLDSIDVLVCEMETHIKSIVPEYLFDFTIEVDDEYISHVVSTKEHILELRMLELEEGIRNEDSK